MSILSFLCFCLAVSHIFSVFGFLKSDYDVPRCIFSFVFVLLHVFWASWICDVLTFISFGNSQPLFFSNVSSATFFHLQQLLPSHAGYCHSSSVVCLPHVLVCITSMGVSLRSGRFPSLCQHLMSTSKQFFTSADTLCLVWDLDSRVFPSVTEPWAFTTSCMLAPKEIPVRALVPSPETACHCSLYDTRLMVVAELFSVLLHP